MHGLPRVLALSLNRPGSLLLAVCSDRVIRLYEVSKQRAQPAGLHSADAVRRALVSVSVRRIPTTLMSLRTDCTLMQRKAGQASMCAAMPVGPGQASDR